MTKLKTVAAAVKRILETCPQARNSDSFMYLMVLAETGGRELLGKSISYVLVNQKELGIPNYETVRRARQKIQAQYPELAACDKVSALRSNNETEYRAFALSKVGVE